MTGYRVYRNGSQVGTTASTSYSDTGLSEVTSYSYRVAAYDAAGNTSAQCTAVAVSTLDATAPSVPANLQATVVSTSRIDLSWTASTDNVAVAGYRVYRDGSLVASPAGTSYSDTGLSAGTTYSYRVAAYRCGREHLGPVQRRFRHHDGRHLGRHGPHRDRVDGPRPRDRRRLQRQHLRGGVHGRGTWTGRPTTAAMTFSSPSTTRLGDAAVDSPVRHRGKRPVRLGRPSPSTGAATSTSRDTPRATWTARPMPGARTPCSSSTTRRARNSGPACWERQSSDSAWAVAVDGSGNIYISGFTDGDLDGQTNSGGTDAFLTKYNSSGTLQWTRLLGNATVTYSYAVAVGRQRQRLYLAA